MRKIYNCILRWIDNLLARVDEYLKGVVVNIEENRKPLRVLYIYNEPMFNLESDGIVNRVLRSLDTSTIRSIQYDTSGLLTRKIKSVYTEDAIITITYITNTFEKDDLHVLHGMVYDIVEISERVDLNDWQKDFIKTKIRRSL